MIVFKDKQARYNVEETQESLKMQGSISIDEDNRVIDFNGTFYDLQGQYLASFYYRETTDGKCDKNINNVDLQRFSDLDEVLDTLIVNIKDQLPK